MMQAYKKIITTCFLCLLAVALSCLLAACSSGKEAGTPGKQTDVVSENPPNTDVPSDTLSNPVQEAAATVKAEPVKAANPSKPEIATKAPSSEPEATGDKASSAEPGQTAEPGQMVENSWINSDKPIGKDNGYSFYLDADNSVYAEDSEGKRADCTMLSEYSSWAAYFTIDGDIYIFSETADAKKACSIPSGDVFLGDNNYHIYYISADYSKTYSIDEYGSRHESSILLYGGNYYFALDSSIYTVMPNGYGLKQLYSEHSLEVGPHYEHILELARIENGVIYYTDESTGDVLKCQFDLAEGKAYYVDPSTGKADPR